LISEQLEVLYLCGRTKDFLINPAGLPTRDLLQLARPGLRPKLRAATQRAILENRDVAVEGIRIKRGARVDRISVRVIPLDVDKNLDRVLLVIFEHQKKKLPRKTVVHQEIATGPHALVRELEIDLRRTREDLRLTVKQLVSSNEEVETANEKMMLMREELRAANEELETSKEASQTINEELRIVNNQLHTKIGELETTNDDLENLLRSTDLATIFLDLEFRIRRFTPAARRLISLMPADIGRSIRDYSPKVQDSSLLADAREVLETLSPIRADVSDGEGRAYIRRILPYRTDRDRIEGVVITYTDITERKRSEEHQRVLIRELDHRVKNTLAVITSIARQTVRQSRSLEDFAGAFQGRIMAFARAHNLLSQTQWRGAGLRSIIEKVVAPICTTDDVRCGLNGEDVMLPPKVSVTLAMVLHELATNAVKHGSMSVPAGRLDISWSLDPQHDSANRLQLNWKEVDGPPVTIEKPSGFGTTLVQRYVEYELKGKAQLKFNPEGLQCALDILWPKDGDSGVI
jgi:two-component system CheB/CheR fusion protein